MAFTGFLKIPDIDGESKRAEHEDEIDVFGVTWGVEGSQSASIARGRRRRRAEIEDLTLDKAVDASSPYLFHAAARGKSFEEMVLSVRKDSGEAHLDYLVITMTNAMITDYAMYHEKEEEGDQICETIAISAESVSFKYVVQADDHSAGDEHEIEYDIAAGV